MEDEGVGQGVGGVGAGGAEAGAVDLGHDVGGFVADGFGVAEVLVGAVVGPVREGVFLFRSFGGNCGDSRGGCDVEDAVSEGAKCDGGVADVGGVGQHDLQDGDVSYDWGGDGGDEQKNRCCEEEEDAETEGGVVSRQVLRTLGHESQLTSERRETCWRCCRVRLDRCGGARLNLDLQ